MSQSRKSGIARLLDFFRTADLELVVIVYSAVGNIVKRRQEQDAQVPKDVKRTRRPRAAGAPSQSGTPSAASEA